MEITFIGHSGFLLEWETCYWLFDYYKGDIPAMASGKKIFVFASHKHEDHFNPEIFRLHDKYKDIVYVLSSDIKLTKGKLPAMGITDEISEKILFVKPSNQYEMMDRNQAEIILKTLKSTDCGVAFLLHYQGKTIYHSGDLNLWVWKESTKQYNNDMIAKFNKEMSKLKGITIDIAFAALDSRLGENYYMGLESLLNSTKVKYAFPMHFFGEPAIVQQFKRERAMNIKNTIIMDIDREGQKWII